MLVKLRVLRGSHAGKEIRIPIPHFLIGRGEECHLRPASDLISRKHCALLVEEQRVVLQDFGNKNGTFVNGRRVEGTWVLEPGDVLQIGPLHFEVAIESTVPAKRSAVRDVKEAAARTASSSVDDEEDVFQWLEGPDDPAGQTRDMDSRVFKLQETQQLDPEEVTTTQSDTDSSIARLKAEQEQKKATRIPEEKKRTSRKVGTDSREAAAETLRRFFNRR